MANLLNIIQRVFNNAKKPSLELLFPLDDSFRKKGSFSEIKKSDEIKIGFRWYYSEIEEAFCGCSHNYIIHIWVNGSYKIYPYHTYYNGSWEAVETILLREIEILKQKGYKNIEYIPY